MAAGGSHTEGEERKEPEEGPTLFHVSPLLAVFVLDIVLAPTCLHCMWVLGVPRTRICPKTART